jgi:hypothetical protein
LNNFGEVSQVAQQNQKEGKKIELEVDAAMEGEF